ncbi:MAG: cytochrome B [Sphingomonas hengshuiensis]|uniref:Cytochrome B n=2 Tax=Sphingomonas TaxID=13687 RepID=A0A2W4YVR8_9SPHN|nr:MAG: cytochrome B [Sphingomonas hengshuiensis]
MKDDKRGYGTITRVLHWGMAALILWQLGGMIVKTLVGRSPLTGFWVGTHGSVGTLVLVLVLLRTFWAISQRDHRPPHGTGLVGTLANAGHVALYALMMIVPALAVLRMIGSERPIQLFGITLRGAAAPVEWMTAPAQLLHGTLAWLLLALIVGHVAMALIHQFVWRDGTLRRMAGRRGSVARQQVP